MARVDDASAVFENRALRRPARRRFVFVSRFQADGAGKRRRRRGTRRCVDGKPMLLDRPACRDSSNRSAATRHTSSTPKRSWPTISCFWSTAASTCRRRASWPNMGKVLQDRGRRPMPCSLMPASLRAAIVESQNSIDHAGRSLGRPVELDLEPHPIRQAPGRFSSRAAGPVHLARR